jgi:hypothetical protein
MKKGKRKCASKGVASHELLREVFKKPGAKNVAQELGLSLSLIHQWSRPRGESGTGALNPLDRVAETVRLTGDLQPVHWLCTKADGFFVKNPRPQMPAASLLAAENEAVREMAALLKAIAEATEDNQITPAEAAGLRLRWEKLKPVMEGFVLRCERGAFRCKTILWALGWWLATGEAPMPAEAV